MDQNEFRLVSVEMELVIRAPRERVFAALTTEYGNWWPHRYKPDSECYCDARPGGAYGERFKNGGGAIYGQIVYFDPGHLIVSSGGSSLGKGFSAYGREEVLDHPDGTLYRKSMQLWGLIPEEMEKMFREGTRQLMEEALVDYVEKGIGYSVAEEKL